jgi:hypothetical protein
MKFKPTALSCRTVTIDSYEIYSIHIECRWPEALHVFVVGCLGRGFSNWTLHLAHFRAILRSELRSTVDIKVWIFNGKRSIWDLLGGDVRDCAGLSGSGPFLLLPSIYASSDSCVTMCTSTGGESLKKRCTAER